MDKGDLHHRLVKIRRFKPYYFVILFIISAVICLFALRANNLHMEALRNQVYSADKSGQGVETALQNLQLYVTHHMNTSLTNGDTGVWPPIQLKYTYERQQKALLAQMGGTDFYTEAQTTCQQQYPVESSLSVWQSYVACVQNYLKDHSANVSSVNLAVPASLYEFDFASPSWSPDLAGWSLFATILFLVVAVVLWIVNYWLRRRTSK